MSSYPDVVQGVPDLTHHAGPRIGARGLWFSWGDLFSVEASFVLFLFSGRYKTIPELKWFPLDFTLLFLALTLALIALGFVSGRLKAPPLGFTGICFLLLTEFAGISFFWSSLDPLNLDKLQRFLILTAPSFYLAAVFGADPVRRLRMLRVIVWFSIVYVGRYYFYRYAIGIDLVDASGDMGSRLPADDNTYLAYGGHAAILFSVYLASSVYRPWMQFWWGMAAMACTLFALADIGGRGPLALALLSVPVTAFMLLLRTQDTQRGLIRLIILFAVLSGGGLSGLAAARISGSQFRTIERYELQLSNEDTSSMDERTQGRLLAYRMWLEKPLFGWGIGEFRVWDSYLNYPHNLLLEVLVELGIVGGVLFSIVLVTTVGVSVRDMRHAAWDWVHASYALLFITELVSHLTVQGYLAEDRIFFSYVAINLVAAFHARSRPVRP